MSYTLLKNMHMAFAVASLSGFVLRWWWMKAGSPLLQHKLARILPHIIDTLFLAAGIWLAFTIQQYPFTHAWLSAKVLGLVAYIILGSLALKNALGARARTVAFIAALLVFAWIVSVARLKNPWGILSLLS